MAPLDLLPRACIVLLALAGCARGERISDHTDTGTASGDPARYSIERLESGVRASLRGLDVVDGRVAWASGSEGHVGLTSDGGRSWTFRRVAGYEDRDFRDVEGFSAERALVMAVASPGLILETTDGGETWAERFRDERPEVFLDAIECVEARRSEASESRPGAKSGPRPSPTSSLALASDREEAEVTCLAFGDPIDGRFLLLRSTDGGRRWTEIEGPAAIPGEAAFAASGTALRFGRRGRSASAADGSASGAHGGADAIEVVIGTGGGDRARVLSSRDLGRSWRAEEVPLAAAASSRGVFSLVEGDVTGWVAVGGDHLAEYDPTGTAARQEPHDSPVAGEAGATGRSPIWVASATPPAGYRSAVARLGDGRSIATGPNGIDLSEDGGRSWSPIAKEGFHAVSSSPSGDLVLLAGADGRIARLIAD